MPNFGLLREEIANLRTQTAFVFQEMLAKSSDFKKSLSRRQEISKRFFQLQKENQQKMNAITKLQIQGESAQQEVIDLREKLNELATEKKRYQRELLARAAEPEEQGKRLRHIDAENRALNELNRKYAEEVLTLKEKLVRLEGQSNEARLVKMIRKLEVENEQLSDQLKRVRDPRAKHLEEPPVSTKENIPVQSNRHFEITRGVAVVKRFDAIISSLDHASKD